jgi:hypothetical protein
MIPNINDISLELKLLEGRNLAMEGYFADFRTSEPKDGEELVRDYKATRAEFKFPCEHFINSACEMEMQIFA